MIPHSFGIGSGLESHPVLAGLLGQVRGMAEVSRLVGGSIFSGADAFAGPRSGAAEVVEWAMAPLRESLRRQQELASTPDPRRDAERAAFRDAMGRLASGTPR